MRDLHDLPKLRDGLSFLYVERGNIEREQNAVTFNDLTGQVNVPVASLAVLMLGPGTTITHAAIKVLADNGCTVLWCGEDMFRFYASGTGETRKAYHLLRQAEQSTDPAKRLGVVEKMYRKRFQEQVIHSAFTIQQLRGREGARVRDAYAKASIQYGVEWTGRIYDRMNWRASDPVNRALSVANACLYGLCHAGIVSGGYSTALGFIHTGKQLSFVYDIADLYKVETAIQVAFEVAAEKPDNLESRTRSMCRKAFETHHLLDRILPDIDELLGITEHQNADFSPDEDPAQPTELWEPGIEK